MSGFARPPVFIVGSAKSGTTLMRTLFESHPEVVAFPFELQVFRYSSLPTSFPLKLRARFAEAEHVAEALLRSRDMQEFLCESQKEPRRIPYAGRKVAACFRQECSLLAAARSLADIIVALFAALAKALDRNLDEIVAVEKTPFQEEFAPLLASWFPDARFIHVVRHPTANLVALRKRERSRRLLDLAALVAVLHHSHVFGRRNAEGVRNYRVVRYEDLVTDPEPTMRALAAHAGIAWHPTLLTPTQWGEPWAGNSMHGLDLCGIDASPLRLWRERARPIDHAFVEAGLDWVCETYGYDTFPPSLLATFRPVAGENPISYLLNRVALAACRRRARFRELSAAPASL